MKFWLTVWGASQGGGKGMAEEQAVAGDIAAAARKPGGQPAFC